MNTRAVATVAGSICGLACLAVALAFGPTVEVAFGVGAIFGVLACIVALQFVH